MCSTRVSFHASVKLIKQRHIGHERSTSKHKQQQATPNHADQRLSCENRGRVVGNPTWGSLNLCKDLGFSQHAKISPTPSTQDWSACGALYVLAWNVLSDRRPLASTHPGPAVLEQEHNMDISLVKKRLATPIPTLLLCLSVFHQLDL